MIWPNATSGPPKSKIKGRYMKIFYSSNAFSTLFQLTFSKSETFSLLILSSTRQHSIGGPASPLLDYTLVT